MVDYRLYLVTDDPSRYRGDWLENVRGAVEGGVTCVQYRDTESGERVQYARLLALRDALGGRAALVVNNNAALARAVRAEGVHVGQGDLPPAVVREIVGPDCEIGLSITAKGQVAAIDRANVNVLGIGPFYDARKTKRDAATALGPEGLRGIVSLVPDFPNCAIGGLTPENAEAALRAGAKGLAVVSAFSRSENPYDVARSFRLLLDHCGK